MGLNAPGTGMTSEKAKVDARQRHLDTKEELLER
jgi:hypothetical protein